MHNQPSEKSIGKDPVTWLYPLVEPYNTGRLKVSPLHEIYFEESGNPLGKPVVFLHGGPGGGSEPKQRRFFHPDKYRVVNFDQRGSGKSTPYASLEENTTWDLVGDIEKLREHLGIARWMVFGGSSGSTLALAYSETYPDLLHDRDGKFCPAFSEVMRAGKVRTLQLPARSPNLNAYAERWVRSVKQECTSRLIFFGENSLRRALTQYTEHYHGERNHRGKGNELQFPLSQRPAKRRGAATIQCKERLGGLLKYCERRLA